MHSPYRAGSLFFDTTSASTYNDLEYLGSRPNQP